MKLTLILLIALLATATPAAFTQKNKYIGYRHKGVVVGATLPNGVKDLGGGLLSNESYGVSRFSKGKQQMLWLERMTGRDASGVPSWIVRDVLTFESLKKNQDFLMSFSSTCTLNGKESFDMIVRAELLPKTKKYKIIEAWRANVRREKFESIAIKGIKCEYAAP